MGGVIIKESFISGSQGEHWLPKRFPRAWILIGGGFSCTLCLTAELLSDRINFKLFSLPLGFCAPFLHPTLLFNHIEKIEIRKGTGGFKALVSLLPKPTFDQRIKTFLFVRKPELWLEHFKTLGLKVDYIDYP